MKFNIRGKDLKITEAIKEYAEKKLGKLSKYFADSNDLNINVLMKVKNKAQTAEVTIPYKKIILRAEETGEDIYASLDLVSDKLERQIIKNKRKLIDKKFKNIELGFIIEEEPTKHEEHKIVKRKTLEKKPMNEEEAILEMNMIGHDFFIFKDSESDNICVVYKRKDNNYGKLEII
jgi:ribosomal subunit interface protein